jgi:flagellar basal body rod protein FlgB
MLCRSILHLRSLRDNFGKNARTEHGAGNIFTEWEDTKRYLRQQLTAAIEHTDRAEQRIEVFSGSTSEDQRTQIKRAFNADPSKHPVRILIATESAREGLNLQAHCWNLFHFDVPWNPSRMEQRNGRIDRKLQPKDEVFCHYFYYRQRPEDRVLKKLIEKTKTIRTELGSLSQVIDARLDKKMAQGIRRRNVEKLENEIEETDIDPDERLVMEEELEASRERQDDLRAQIDRLRTILDSSRKSIGLNEELFRLAISSSLNILGAEPLQPVHAKDQADGPERCVFPSLDQREGADPTWADTMDTLRSPRDRSQKPWEWRRESPIRPVVFEDPGTMTDDVVHLHLEHRVVQRLLGRFISQGFVFDDLSRACLTQTRDAIPRVVLLGRLALYGPGAARLHEELVPVTARWNDPRDRGEPLSPYARDAESKTLALLDEAFQKSTGRKLETEVMERLQAAAAQDVKELLDHLQQRGEDYAADAEKKLAERAETEAKAMVEILQRQKKHISSTQKAAENRDWKQMRLRFSGDDVDVEEEKRQFDANKRYWAQRLEMLKDELKTEPDRIREVYSVKAKRIEPVGLVYLWPVTG